MSREAREKSIIIMSRRGTNNAPVPMTESLFYLNEEMERIQASFASNNFMTMRSLPKTLHAGNILRHAQTLQKSHGEFHGTRAVWSPAGVGDDAPCFMPVPWPTKNAKSCPELKLKKPKTAPAPAEPPADAAQQARTAEAPERTSLAASFEANMDPPPFVCTFRPHELPHPWMSEPHPKHLVYPNVRPEWCSPSWRATPISPEAFIPCGKSRHRVRPLLRSVLRKLGAKIAAAWPDAAVRMDPRTGPNFRGDRVRVAVAKASVPQSAHNAVRAYLRNLSLDDRMLDRRVRFQHNEPDDDSDEIAAAFVVWETMFAWWEDVDDFDWLTDTLKMGVVDMMCDGGIGADGDQLESGSPMDPSFWSIHPTMERIFVFKKISNTFEDEDWPTHGAASVTNCTGHQKTSTVPFKFSLKNGDDKGNAFDETLLTNEEVYDLLDPSTSDMPYIYQDFAWKHCEWYGYNFADLLDNYVGTAGNTGQSHLAEKKGKKPAKGNKHPSQRGRRWLYGVDAEDA